MFVRFIGETETWVCFGFCVCLSMPDINKRRYKIKMFTILSHYYYHSIININIQKFRMPVRAEFLSATSYFADADFYPIYRQTFEFSDADPDNYGAGHLNMLAPWHSWQLSKSWLVFMKTRVLRLY